MRSDENELRLQAGAAGVSARREHERRRDRRHARVRVRHPRLGGVILALSDEPTHERVWARGAAGEERVAQSLAKRLNEKVVVLHDRRVPRTRANIDHIAVAPSGIWVIDSKRYKGKVAVVKPLLGAAKLTIAGRDRTKLIGGLAKQVELVRAAAAEIAPEVPVHGALCFVDADLPLIGTLRFRGFPLVYPKALAKQINRPGPVTPEQLHAVASALAAHFPPA